MKANPSDAPRKRWRAYLTDRDFAAKDFLSSYFNTDAEAIRSAMSNQVQRDKEKSTDPGLLATVRTSVNGMLSKSRRHGQAEYKMDQYVLFLSESEKAMLDEIAEANHLDGRVAAFRFALRVEASLLGFVPEGGVW